MRSLQKSSGFRFPCSRIRYIAMQCDVVHGGISALLYGWLNSNTMFLPDGREVF